MGGRDASIALVLMAAIAVHTDAQQSASQPTRDQIRRAPVGTAIVSGTVISDEPTPAPIRRARVALVKSDLTSLSGTTDDAGRFVISGVPAGTYRAQGSKAAWLQSEYGATKSGRSGTPIVVRDGDRIQNITIRLTRGAVVSGAVTGRAGQPLPDVEVQVLRRSISTLTGEPQYGLPSAGARATTDDEGNYRVFGLTSGTYVVVATMRSGPAAALMDLDQQTAAEVSRITADAANATADNRAAAPRSPVGFAPVFFPGVADPSRVVEFKLDAGEERAGMNLVMEPVRTATVSVVASLPDGVDPASVQITLQPDSPIALAGSTPVSQRPTRREADGRYIYQGLSAGTYTLLARAGSSRETLTHYASVSLAIDGRDQAVPLELVPGMTVSGQAIFEGDSAQPKEVSDVSIVLVAAGAGPGLNGPRGTMDATGAFRIAGVPAGKYRVAFIGTSKTGWYRTAVRAGTVDVLEDGLHVTPAGDVSITLSYASTPSELKGQLQLSSGRPALDYTLLVFSEDRRYWKALSTRVSRVKPSSDGSYSFTNLPAGEYLLAAVTDIDPGEPLDAEMLEQIAPAAVKVRITGATVTIQNLQIK